MEKGTCSLVMPGPGPYATGTASRVPFPQTVDNDGKVEILRPGHAMSSTRFRAPRGGSYQSSLCEYLAFICVTGKRRGPPHPSPGAAGLSSMRWDLGGNPQRRRKTSFIFSFACRVSPLACWARPSAVSRSLPVARPTASLALPLSSSAFPLAFFSAATALTSLGSRQRCSTPRITARGTRKHAPRQRGPWTEVAETFTGSPGWPIKTRRFPGVGFNSQGTRRAGG